MDDAVKKLLAPDKGVLALDWSPSTIAKQFAKFGLTSSPELNQAYRQMLVGSSELSNYVSGIILHEETINQKLDNGNSFTDELKSRGIVVGVRADNGSEKYKDTDQDTTNGLDGLGERLETYRQKGVSFTKWRAAYKISDLYPSKEFVEESSRRLALFAKASHEAHLVPFVEPDVEMNGNHTTTRCEEITTLVLRTLFEHLRKQSVDLSKIILKTNMVLPGKDGIVVAEPLEVANSTLRALRNSVPPEVPGIVFLSGGQSYDDSVMHLDKIEDLSKDDPWKLSFSFARSLQVDALRIWGGKVENVDEAQKALIFRLQKVAKARMGKL